MTEMIFDTSQRLGSHVWCGVVWDLIVERWHTIFSDLSTQRYSWFQKKTGIEHFPNVNLVLFIFVNVVYLTIPIK
jgi:hypothetical protein